MSITPMDLDSSLDDLIKKRKNKTNNNNKKPNQQQQQQKSFGGKNKQPISSRLSVQTKAAKVTKPTHTSSINSRLSTSSTSTVTTTATTKKSGPLFTFKQQQQQQQSKKVNADPSQIIITKAFSPSSVSPSNLSITSRLKTDIKSTKDTIPVTSILHGRLGKHKNERVEHTLYNKEPIQETTSNFTIRGLSNNISPTTGLSIKHKSGPTLVLISGLDPGTSSDDLRLALEPFGYMLRCEVVRNRQGRSYGEAEVEFSTKAAALDCIAKLDNTMADGQFLRVLLRENNPPLAAAAAAKPIQSVISQPSFVPSGKMYADQMSPRYDIRRQ